MKCDGDSFEIEVTSAVCSIAVITSVGYSCPPG